MQDDKILDLLKKKIAGRQFFKCANKPNNKLKGLEKYKCPLWDKDKNNEDRGSFDEYGYEIDFVDKNNDDETNLHALCKYCFNFKTKNKDKKQSIMNKDKKQLTISKKIKNNKKTHDEKDNENNKKITPIEKINNEYKQNWNLLNKIYMEKLTALRKNTKTELDFLDSKFKNLKNETYVNEYNKVKQKFKQNHKNLHSEIKKRQRLLNKEYDHIVEQINNQ